MANNHLAPAKRSAIANFKANLTAVENLMDFDRQVMDFLSTPLERLKGRLVRQEATNPYLQPDTLITTIAQLRDHGALRPYYQAMYNQCLVLAVSHFASATRDLFVEGLAAATERPGSVVFDESVRIKVEHLVDESIDRRVLAAEAIADGGDNSWQDMQSIARAFTKYFGRAPDRDAPVNDIIVAQAVRHVIVHAGSKTDRRLLSQIKKATPRGFNPRLALDEAIQLSPDDVRHCGQSMQTYLGRLAGIVGDAAI